MEIKKIKLVNGGYKGIELSFLETEVKENKKAVGETTRKRRFPIHLALETHFKSLRFFLLDIVGIVRGDMDKNYIDYTVADCDVHTLKLEGGAFKILGTKKCVGGETPIETTEIEPKHEYEHYDTVVNIIKAIKEETVEYMNGTKKIDDNELAVRWIRSGKDKNFDQERYDNMTTQERADYHIDIIQKLGGFVTMQDDIIEDNEENREILELKPDDTFELNAEEIEIPLRKA